MHEPMLKEIISPLARDLAELVLLEKDVRSARDAFKFWFSKFSGRKLELTPEETLISQSLFRDSIVMFIGCFDKTAPLSLSVTDLYTTPDQLSYFEWLKDIRDSYAAHKFGPFRQCVTGVFVDQDGKILGSGHSNRIYAGFVPEGRGTLLSFINIAGRHLEKRMNEMSRRLTEEARAMSKEELDSLRPAKTFDVEPHEVRVSREKFKKKIPKKGTGS